MITKRILIPLILVFVLAGTALGQQKKVSYEALYFKANLACCKARACNALQNDVELSLKKFFEKENIIFRVIMLADTTQNDLITKYHAKSQTVVIRKIKGKNEKSADVSDIVAQYAQSRDLGRFEGALKSRVSEMMK